MATATVSKSDWTVADLFERFGPIPIARICMDPPPGSATEADVPALDDHEDRLCELVDGVLVEKAMGFEESVLGGWIVTLLNNYVRPRKLGKVAAADGMFRLLPGLIRIPDAAFISNERYAKRRRPKSRVAQVAPDLAVEVLSESNTEREMDGKLRDYFRSGVRLVWYVDPGAKTVRVYTSLKSMVLLNERDKLGGGKVLPGFSVPVAELFETAD